LLLFQLEKASRSFLYAALSSGYAFGYQLVAGPCWFTLSAATNNTHLLQPDADAGMFHPVLNTQSSVFTNTALSQELP
jgi:hypothetical protein